MKKMRIMKAIGGIDDKYIEEAAPAAPKENKIHLVSQTKYAEIAACAVLVLGIGIFAVTKGINISHEQPQIENSQTTAVTDDTGLVEYVNPFADFESLEEAEKAVGFDITVPDSFGDFTERSFFVISGDMLEIQYSDKSGNIGMSIRKSLSTEDISGDHNQYEQISEINISDRRITIKGNDNVYFLAVWQDSEYSYSVSAENGISEEELIEIIENIK